MAVLKRSVPNLQKKVLIIRFSSLGDIAQAFAAAELLATSSSVDWVTRADFVDFISRTTCISRVWSVERKTGFRGLLNLAFRLRQERYDLVYDAHSNLRSHILSLLLWRPNLTVVRRSKDRLKRILLFRFRKNLFQSPFRGAWSFVEPLSKMVSLPSELPTIRWVSKEGKADFRSMVLMAPSAAWDLKKWPIEHWRDLVLLLPNLKIGLLGGPEDNFTELVKAAPDRVQNFAGKMSWSETSQAIFDCQLLVSADTGALHIADNFNKLAIAIIGPTAFGFPSRPSSFVLDIPLWCRPCTKDGRGKCVNAEYKKCLKDIRPETVAAKVKALLS